jgi:hypothetical protein
MWPIFVEILTLHCFHSFPNLIHSNVHFLDLNQECLSIHILTIFFHYASRHTTEFHPTHFPAVKNKNILLELVLIITCGASTVISVYV